jgi:hypothetical protein
MLRYLRGKGILDLLHDGIRRFVPGTIGAVLAILITLMLGLAYMLVRNHVTLVKWF